ncbi:MAG: hypothetical protein IPO40_23405 [Fibrobacteres bacterium]|nr:hypothetical protein [Fibrobacterota bacterium]
MMMNFSILFRLFMTLAFPGADTSACEQKIKLDWYGMESKELNDLAQLGRSATQEVEINSSFKFHFPLSYDTLTEDGDTVLRPIFLSKKKAITQIRNAKDKNLLVVQLDKSVMWSGGDKANKILNRVKSMTSNLGFDRVIIFGAHCCGVFYLSDSCFKKSALKHNFE